jgi:hypothetical protein
MLISSQKNEVENLPLKYQKWLKEEVVYIITDTEKDVFLSLKSDQERDIYIEAFWKQGDPTPGGTEGPPLFLYKNTACNKYDYTPL